ncbi:DUF7520 family protein [Halomicrobium salinisoli]|uniref:DUF7520 family protein n=1 Tax=Halomicrobium salinisoli TaxID=2878391 RepID=UPI001CF09C4C|nr:cox cluster protein [Halomicrobium salinisoli]
MTERAQPRAGNRVVVTIYLIIVALAGVMGFVLGLIRPENLDPRLFGVVELPPTPFGVAVYGLVTVAVVLGVLLALVSYVSEKYPNA